jgi:outer membrane protein TolC
MSFPGLTMRATGKVWLPLLGLLALTGVARTTQAETLSAEAALAQAAEHNPSLRAALLDSLAASQRVQAERGARDPSLVVSVQGEYTEDLSRPGLSGANTGVAGATSRSSATRVGSNAAVRYTTDVGTELELGTSAGTSWNRTSWSGTSPSLPPNLSLGPTYTAEAYLSARQPLLRGAGSDGQLGALHQAQAAKEGAEQRQTLAASQTALDVLNAYWELWYAERALSVEQEALAVAERQLGDARVRAETLGTGSNVDVLQFSTSAAAIAESLSVARATRSTRAIELGRLLGVQAERAGTLEATGSPPELQPLPALGSLLGELQSTSPELAAARADIEQSKTRVRSARDADQPRVDLFTTASVGTLWDDGETFSLSGGRPAFSILGGVELTLPLGGGRTPADAALAATELEAAEARYQAQRDALEAELRSRDVELRAAGEQVALTALTHKNATELAAAERQRLLLGTTTSQNVVTAEQTLRAAELRRLRALVSELTSRFQLEHTAGQLLTHFAPTLARRSS